MMTGADLKRRREALDLTQHELAVALGTPETPLLQQHVSRWERGTVRITPLRAAWLDQALSTLERRSHRQPLDHRGGRPVGHRRATPRRRLSVAKLPADTYGVPWRRDDDAAHLPAVPERLLRRGTDGD